MSTLNIQEFRQVSNKIGENSTQKMISTPAPITKENKSMAAGIFSVFIMFLLTFVGIYSFQTLNDPKHFEMCSSTTAGPATWAVYNFYFSTFGGGIGAVYELYLVLIGKVFEVQTIPIVPRIRGFNAGYIFTVGLIFDAFMVVGTKNSYLLNELVIFLGVVGVLVAPGLAFPKSTGEKIGQAYFGLTTLISLILIWVYGTEFGGALTTSFLVLNKASSTIGVVVTPPNKSLQNNIQFHILRLIANILVIVGYLNATAESPCFPQEAESKISSNFLPALAISAVAGWAFHITINASSENTEEGKTEEIKGE